MGVTGGIEKGLPSRGVGISQVDGTHRKTVSSLDHPQNHEKDIDNGSGLATFLIPTFTEGMVRVLQLALKCAEGNSSVNRVNSIVKCPVKFLPSPFYIFNFFLAAHTSCGILIP